MKRTAMVLVLAITGISLPARYADAALISVQQAYSRVGLTPLPTFDPLFGALNSVRVEIAGSLEISSLFAPCGSPLCDAELTVGHDFRLGSVTVPGRYEIGASYPNELFALQGQIDYLYAFELTAATDAAGGSQLMRSVSGRSFGTLPSGELRPALISMLDCAACLLPLFREQFASTSGASLNFFFDVFGGVTRGLGNRQGLSDEGVLSITYDYTPLAVPQPSTSILLSLGLMICGVAVRARHKVGKPSDR